MPTATVQNILDGVRARLNDQDTSGGAIFTNAMLLGNPAGSGPFATAYRRLYDSLDSFCAPDVKREWYYNLPAYTSVLSPSAAGLLDMAEPHMVRERGALTTQTIVTTSNSTPIVVNIPGHGRSNNDDLVISAVNGTQGPLGRWFITVIDPNNFSLNGSVTDGSAGTGGTATVSVEKFTDLDPLDSMTDRDLNNRLIEYVWEESVLKFRGATQQRQLWVTYIASGNAPTSASVVIGMDNCQNFLIAATAAVAARSKGWNNMADNLAREAYGAKGEADGSGGLLRDFLNVQVLEMQRKQRRAGQFRRQRNAPIPFWQ